MHDLKNSSSKQPTPKTYRAKKVNLAKSYDDFLEVVAEETTLGFCSQWLGTVTSRDLRMVRF